MQQMQEKRSCLPVQTAVVCQSKPAKTVQSIEQDHSQNGGDDDPQTSYNQVTWKLDQVSTNSPAPQQPNEYNTKVTIRVQDQRLKVQVESGAEVNIIDHTTYRNLSRKPPLRSTNAKLKPYGSKLIPVERILPSNGSSKWPASEHHLLRNSRDISGTYHWKIYCL